MPSKDHLPAYILLPVADDPKTRSEKRRDVIEYAEPAFLKRGGSLPAPNGKPTPSPRWSLVCQAVLACVALGLWLAYWQLGAAPGAAPPEPAPSHLPAQAAINWTSCANGPPRLRCGTIQVPLDHTRPHGPNITLAVAVYPAAQQPADAIFFNPGGPGGSGLAHLANHAEEYNALLDGRFNLVSFDPRGVGASTPIRCAENLDVQAAVLAESMALVPRSFSMKGPAIKLFLKQSAMEAQLCQKYSADLMPHVSTWAAAHDLELLREVFGQPLLNYWGFSYGTFLGVTYANLFPDRVGRFVVDGVTDPDAYSGSPLHFVESSLSKFPAVLDAFGRLCEEAGPEACPLAHTAGRNKTGYVMKELNAFFKRLDADPMLAVDANVPGAVDGYQARGGLLGATYKTAAWKDYTVAVAEARRTGNNATLLRNMARDMDGLREPGVYANSAICGSDLRSTDMSVEEHIRGVERLAKRTGSFASFMWGIQSVSRLGWPAPAKRYIGPWNAKTKTRVLVVGNTNDPVTPLSSAQKVAKLLSGILVEIDTVGHCTGVGKTSNAPTCVRNIRKYFLEGPDSFESAVVKCKETFNPFLMDTQQ